jgi:hypothetical protein
VHWGRKKKLPLRLPSGGRAKRDLRAQSPALEASDEDSYDDSEAAEMLIVLSCSATSALSARRMVAEGCDGDEAEVVPTSGLPHLGARRVPATSSATNTSEGDMVSVDQAASNEAAPLLGTVASAAAAPAGVPVAATAAPFSTQQSPHLQPNAAPSVQLVMKLSRSYEALAALGGHKPLDGAPSWPVGFVPLPPPSAFDMFRADWQAAYPTSSWSDARHAWASLPEAVSGVYHRRACAAMSGSPSFALGLGAPLLQGCAPVTLAMPAAQMAAQPRPFQRVSSACCLAN